VKLTLDLHDIYNQGSEIDRALQRIFDEAVAKKAPVIEIIPRQGQRPAQEARTAVPRAQGHQAAVPPGGEGLQELRPPVCPLPLEISRP
jgi:hypothetical protein